MYPGWEPSLFRCAHDRQASLVEGEWRGYPRPRRPEYMDYSRIRAITRLVMQSRVPSSVRLLIAINFSDMHDLLAELRSACLA